MSRVLRARPLMTFHSLIRAVGSGRRTNRPDSKAPLRPASGGQRHPAMSGLKVSPVHGRHCICDRCARDGDERLPLAG